MENDTKAIQDAIKTVKIVGTIIALIVSVLLIYISTNLSVDEWIRDLSREIGFAVIVFALGAAIAPYAYIRKIFKSHYDEKFLIQTRMDQWERYGIYKMSDEWTNFRSSTGDGKEVRDQLKTIGKNATWYIITINPEGFSGEFLNNVILPAIESGVKVKWSYVSLPDADKDPSSDKVLRDWWDTQYTIWTPDKEKNINYAMQNLTNNLREIIRLIQERIEIGSIQPEDIQIFESHVPTTYLTLLAVKNQVVSQLNDNLSKALNVKDTGLALVYPYIMFSTAYQSHWGMILTSPGKLYEEYALSTIRFFEEGTKRGYLHRIWPKS